MDAATIRFVAYRVQTNACDIWNPTGEGSFVGGLQISRNLGSKSFQQLADYFQMLAQAETSDEPYFHHHEPY